MAITDPCICAAESNSTSQQAAPGTSPSTLIPGCRMGLLWETANSEVTGVWRRGSSATTPSGRESTSTWVASGKLDSKWLLRSHAVCVDWLIFLSLFLRCPFAVGARSTKCLWTGNTCATTPTACLASTRSTCWRSMAMCRSPTSTSERMHTGVARYSAVSHVLLSSVYSWVNKNILTLHVT